MGKEVELKFLIADKAQGELILNHPMIKNELCGPVQIIKMESIYFDTVDGNLTGHNFSLRRRCENDRVVYTVKTSSNSQGALSERGEWEVCAEDADSALALLREQGAPEKLFEIIGKSRLTPCAHVSFTRKTAPLRFGAHLCIDTGLLEKTPFSEMEIELSTGNIEDLIAFGSRCAEEFNLIPESLSKFTRARALHRDN